LGDEADTWRYVIDALARDYHLIAPDLPGFGRSDKPDVDYTPDFMISTLIGLLDKIGVDQTILIGSSLGAMLSHAIALHHPGRVQGLVLIGGALLQTDKATDRGLRLMQIPFLGEWLYTRLRKNPDAAFDSMRNVYHDLDKMPNPDREFL
jgi:pimeloyl-ACP methyl ester carboxylesterase